VVWLATLYLAKIVLAHFIGARVLQAAGNRAHYVAALAVGLALVILAINVLYVGGAISFVLTICGIGVLALHGWRTRRNRADDTVAAARSHEPGGGCSLASSAAGQFSACAR